MPARTSPTLLPPSPRTVLSLSCFKVSSASIVVTGTVRVNEIKLWIGVKRLGILLDGQYCVSNCTCVNDCF